MPIHKEIIKIYLISYKPKSSIKTKYDNLKTVNIVNFDILKLQSIEIVKSINSNLIPFQTASLDFRIVKWRSLLKYWLLICQLLNGNINIVKLQHPLLKLCFAHLHINLIPQKITWINIIAMEKYYESNFVYEA